MVIKKKIVLLGDSAVGKTSLIRRFVYDHFDDSYIATVGSKVTKKDVQVQRADGSVKLSLIIWDLIGREGYAAFHSRSLVGTQGALLVTDLTREETLGSLERYWIPMLFKIVGNVPLVFASNKSDLKSEFEFEMEDLERVASKFNKGTEAILPPDLSTSYSTSAKTGGEVENAFASLAHLTLSDKKPEDPLAELFEELVATRVRRTSDTSTPIGALDAIIVDFCDGFDNQKLAMAILRLEITRAGIDVKSPTMEGIHGSRYRGEKQNAQVKIYSLTDMRKGIVLEAPNF
jgi:small GTP-binding protein